MWLTLQKSGDILKISLFVSTKDNIFLTWNLYNLQVIGTSNEKEAKTDSKPGREIDLL
jgi:hypothetical protein